MRLPPTQRITAALLALMFAPSAALAQEEEDDGMSFGLDEVQEEGAAEQEGGMEFGEMEAAPSDEPAPSVDVTRERNSGTLAVVAVPSEGISPAERDELQERMMGAVSENVGGFEMRGESGVLPLLIERGAAECVREALCLASVGEEAGVDSILIGRVTPIGEAVKFDVDLFDVRERLFRKYQSYDDLSGFGEALDRTDEAILKVFEVRVVEQEREIGEPKNEWVQPTFAYTTAALAVGALAGGIFFGLDASGKRDDVAGLRDPDGGFTITQVEADEALEDARCAARTADVFYATALGLGVISAVLFTVDFGSDVASEEELNDRARLDLVPLIGRDQAGVGATLRF